MEFVNFWGNIEAKIDTKGRVFIPVQFRKELLSVQEECVILKKDLHQNCLIIYPKEVWEKLLQELQVKLDKWDPIHQTLFRQFVSDLEILTVDNSGRILIPKRLVGLTNIDSEVRFIGVGNRIEVWAKEELEQALLPQEDFTKALAKIMKDE